MGSPELAQYADFYADTTRRFGLTEDLELWRDISERLHQLTSEPEDVTYRDVTANGVPAILVMPAESSPDHILLHSHSGGGVTASMWQERKAVGHLAKAAGARALVINYRLAPEDKFPAQIDDVEAAYRWLLGQGYDPSRIASSGDSIGERHRGEHRCAPSRSLPYFAERASYLRPGPLAGRGPEVVVRLWCCLAGGWAGITRA